MARFRSGSAGTLANGGECHWKMPELPSNDDTLGNVSLTRAAAERLKQVDQQGGCVSGIDECLLEAMRLPGARGAALVEWVSGLALGVVGEAPGGDHEAMAAEAAEFARSAAELPVFTDPEEVADLTGPGDPTELPGTGGAGPATGTGPDAGSAAGIAPAADKELPVEDVIVVARTGYHLLRFLEAPYEGGVFLHLWLDRAQANLALSLMRLRDLSERLVLE